jgi:hypothetical protein
MSNKSKEYQDDFDDEFEIEEKDERINDELESNSDREPLFPFDKMTYQEDVQAEPGESLHEYEMDNNQRLNLGESPSRLKRRSLDDERGAGHEP